MTTLAISPHRTHLDELARKYRSEGYEVLTEPSASDLPFELGGYVPELLARKGSGGSLIAVKSKSQRFSFEALRAVAEEVRRHPDWKFILVTADDNPGLGLPGTEDLPVTLEDVSQRRAKAFRLIASGEPEAAYLVLWIAFELLLRMLANRIALPAGRLSPSVSIRQLYSLGELSAEQYEEALACLSTRNSVSHGYPAPHVTRDFDRLAVLIAELLEVSNRPEEVV